MNVRLIASPIFVLLLSPFTYGQQEPQGSDEGARVRVEANAGSALKQDLARQVALQEASVRQAEAAHATDVELAKRYRRLSLLYEDAAQMARSEAAAAHAVSLVRHAPEPSEELAAALCELGALHASMGKLRESEKEEQEGLRLREKLGNRLPIASSWNGLAEVFLAQHKYEKARDFARKAVAEFVANEKANAYDRTAARFSLSLAICYLKDCPSAIPLLKDAIAEARAKLRSDDLPVGFGDFLLGYAYWKSGNMSDAGPHMQDGTAALSRVLGASHPGHLNALKQYEQFLRENRQVEAANLVRSRIRQAEAVVDVHSMQTAQGMFDANGLH